MRNPCQFQHRDDPGDRTDRVRQKHNPGGHDRLDNRNEARHILTIEDPVEFVHESRKSLIRHREVGLHTLRFHNALRAALREDPDVILVGESGIRKPFQRPWKRLRLATWCSERCTPILQ